VHNDSVKEASGEILLFTDAATEFERDFLENVVNYFSEDLFGCVVGNLIYKTNGTSISETEGLYWQFEKKLRKLESDIGILSTATGACMAVRKNLWKKLSPIDDADFATPLDIIMQGHRIVYVPDAIAYDHPPSSARGELKTRIRQTSKNFIGTLRHWNLKIVVKHPVVTWGLLSHKILRWFTPFFMLVALISNFLLLKEGIIYQIAFVVQILFYCFALIGFISEMNSKKFSIASTVFSFCVANIGMGIGVIKGLFGKAPAVYKMEE
jgi:cellulose synthase/poly-beta-1,6-N-acetylglucosamine synthase-like glycosyltransferase